MFMTWRCISDNQKQNVNVCFFVRPTQVTNSALFPANIHHHQIQISMKSLNVLYDLRAGIWPGSQRGMELQFNFHERGATIDLFMVSFFHIKLKYWPKFLVYLRIAKNPATSVSPPASQPAGRFQSLQRSSHRSQHKFRSQFFVSLFLI